MDFQPHEYQKQAIQWIIDKPRCGLFLDMGLGKTVTTLTAIDWLINCNLEISNVLVVAPKRVVTETWATECQKWDHLHSLKMVPIVGNPEQRKIATSTKADIHLVSRDNVKWLVEYLGRKWDYDMLVLDELSSFKNPQSNRFKALKKVSKQCNRVVGLTGTPAPNGYHDLWSQMYLLDSGERLGRTLGDFRREYCDCVRYPQFTKWTVPDKNQNVIGKQISDICISMKAKDYLNLPPAYYHTVLVDLPNKAKKAYKTMLETSVLEYGYDDIVGVNAAVVLEKCLQIANGAIYDDDRNARFIHDAKIEALEQIIEEAQGQPILVFYQYKFNRDSILEHFPQAVLYEDGVKEKWDKGEIPILLAQPQSCGHGLNLQHGGHIIVWFGVKWSLELYQQANGRLNRQGQKKPVMIYHLLAKDTSEERVLQALADKNTSQEALNDCVKAELQKVR